MAQNEKRAYTKRNEAYWEGRKNPVQVTSAATVASAEPIPFPEIEAYASCGPQSSSSVRGGQVNQPLTNPSAFNNIQALPLPWVGFNGTRSGYGYGGESYGGSYIGISSAIDLCGRAWAGIGPVRNAIEVAVEFSNQPLYVKCKNKTVKKFFEEWLRAIQINRLKEEFFREYYRSGNIFMMLFEGKFGPSYYQNFQTSFSAKDNRIPIRYELLNPGNVFVPVGVINHFTYARLLSPYEITRLQNPLTPQDKQVYNDLPPEAKEQITNYRPGSPMGIYVPLDSKRLRYAFYKKQSYEPLAVPMVWPILPDVEWKLMLKKMDKALLQNVERIILLVTTGEAPNQWNGGKGINQNNLSNLTALLSNQTLNRVLVADYSTKAQFVQPDLKDLGPEKYAIVNEDIREGLQSILTGDDKFANAQIKAKIFVRRLEEGQSVFLDDFLNVEIGRICDIMGFREKPLVKFGKIMLQDEAIMSRVITQLGQLGILSAEQVVNTLDTGVLPDADEMEEAQEKYKKDRKNGKYFPLVGGSQKDGGDGRPAGTGGTPKSSSSPGPIGTSKGEFSMKELVATLRDRSNLEAIVETELRKATKFKGEFGDAQRDASASLAFAIMATQPREKWGKAEVVKASLKDLPKIADSTLKELEEIRHDYDLRDIVEAVVVKNAKTKGE